MNIIRDEKVTECASLTGAKELHFIESEIGKDFIEEECRKAFQKGRERGEIIGYERALDESKALFELLQTLTQKLLDQNKKLLDSLKPEVIEFAITLCEKVIRKELSQPDTMVNLINSLLISATQLGQEIVKIILAPDDLMMLEEHLVRIQYNKREIVGVTFRADPLMRRGDCRIETQVGLLNYTIARELGDLQSKVLQRSNQALKGESPGARSNPGLKARDF